MSGWRYRERHLELANAVSATADETTELLPRLGLLGAAVDGQLGTVATAVAGGDWEAAEAHLERVHKHLEDAPLVVGILIAQLNPLRGRHNLVADRPARGIPRPGTPHVSTAAPVNWLWYSS